MPTSGEQAPYSGVLDHYGGDQYGNFAPTTPGSISSIAYVRQNSIGSLQGSGNTSSSGHVHSSRAQGGGAGDSSFPLPSPLNTPSVRSSSSSLRQTVDMLKMGVFPPGIQNKRSHKRDSSSDGSHYDDDDDEESENYGYQMERGGPFGSSHSRRIIQPHDFIDIFTNASDSPDVPKRRSSQHSSQHGKIGSKSTSPPSPESPPTKGKSKSEEEEISKFSVTTSSSSSAAAAAASNANTSSFITESMVPLSPNTSVKSTPPKKAASTTAMARTLTDIPVINSQTDVDLEHSLILAAEKDPNRPKTLKEARAFAKERARLRQQARESGDLSSSATVDPLSALTHPLQIEISSKDNTSLSRQDNGSAVKSSESSSSEWRGHSRQVATPLTPRREEEERKYAIDAAEIPPDGSTMEDLQSAVGEAIQDMSFSSSTATGDTIGGPFDSAEPSASFSEATSLTNQMKQLEIPSSRGDADNESSAISVTSFTSAQDTMPISNPISHLKSHGHDSNNSSIREEPVASSEPALDIILPHSPFTQVNANDSSEQQLQETNVFVPHRLQPQQRSTAPNKIARLDVYGKTVPWPPAFRPAAIVEQRRLAPWERARSYAHYCNDLMSTSSGLQIWMELVQRPINRVAEPATPIKKHIRGETTEHSGYAASVRSEATFPMRGDGARAKELVSHIPAVVDQSPPQLLPQNIPYPMLVQQPGRSSTSLYDDSSSTPSSDRGNSRPNFFSNLGRKGSTRRTPGSGSMSGFSALSSSSSSNAIRLRGKPKMISSPMTLNSSSSLANIKSGFENFSEVVSSPSPQGSGQLRSNPPSSPLTPVPATATTTTTSVPASLPNRTPMGPRAPAMAAVPPILNFPDVDAARKGSGAATTGSTDYSASSPTIATPKTSLPYASIRDISKRASKSSFNLQQPGSSDSTHSKSNQSSRRGSHQVTPPTAAEKVALDKLSDVLPDASQSGLLEHLRKAGGNDLLAIGSYLQEKALSEGKVFLQ